jgi:hypothetical protein
LVELLGNFNNRVDILVYKGAMFRAFVVFRDFATVMVRSGPDKRVVRESEDKEPVAILVSEPFLCSGMALDLSGQALDFKRVVDEKFEGFLEDGMAFMEEGDSVFLDVLHGAKCEAMHSAARDEKPCAEEMAFDLTLVHRPTCNSSLLFVAKL